MGVGSGDFDEFFEAEYGPQTRRAYLLIGDLDAAHDVVAGAMERVYGRWAQVRDPGSYLNRCVLNGCRDWGRRRSRVVAVSSVPDAATRSEDLPVDLALILLELPFRQRAALVMRFYGGFSERRIADELGCRPGTVGPLISRGLKRLRKEIS
ncbi:MAG: sigma-70 family RNA polymerase sigma factor [bacterium]|nr:sigma-70 family RNA polymerase sigma factor [bacterium]